MPIFRCDKPTGQTAKAAWLFPELGQIDPAAPQPERLKQLAALREKLHSPRTRYRQEGKVAEAVAEILQACGVAEWIRTEVIRRLAQRRVTSERFAICSSHTHSAPMLNGVLPTIFGIPIPPEHQRNIDRYTREFTDNLEKLCLAALADRQPGSAMKPFIYALALMKGYTRNTVVFDVPTQFSTACALSDTTNSTPPPMNFDPSGAIEANRTAELIWEAHRDVRLRVGTW